MSDLSRWTTRHIDIDLSEGAENFELDEMLFIACADRTSPLWRVKTYMDDAQWLMSMEFLENSRYSPQWMKDCAAKAICHYKKKESRNTIDMHEGPTLGKRDYADGRSPGYVYVAGGDGYFKIGRSKSPVERVNGMSTKLPFEIEIIHVIETNDMCRLESDLHERFGALRLNGEWFNLGGRNIDWIKGIDNETILENER